MSDCITIHKGYQFKLEPTAAQDRIFWRYCGATRWVYNHMLAQRKAASKGIGKIPSTHDQIKQLPILKRQEETTWLNSVQSQVLQDAVLDLNDAFERFFRKQNGYPHWKRKHGRKQSFSYPQGVRVDGNRVWLPKIGWVRFRRSRNIEGTIKRATIRRKASGWYASLLCQVEIEAKAPVQPTPENSIGIDLGSIDLVTTSRGSTPRMGGEKITNQRHYRQTERKLKRAQRMKSRRKPGSRRYANAKQRAANRRRDDLHKLSRQLTDENQAVFCEDLNVVGMAKGNMGKSVGDAGWSELVRQLEYKALWAGKALLKINRYYPSSKTCAHCDYVHADLERAERYWLCPNCTTLRDRDINAAVNVHREGLKLYLAVGHTERQNARGQTVRPAKRARLAEARISRL